MSYTSELKIAEKLLAAAANPEWSSWRPVLEHVARLHELAVLPKWDILPYPPEQIGPGYCYAPAFGHWDLIFQMLDVAPDVPEHAKYQIINDLSLQKADGFLPGSIWHGALPPDEDEPAGHPPLWPLAVDLYTETTGNADLRRLALPVLRKQIDWFERHRSAESGGFYYLDVLNHNWESGIDESLRCTLLAPGKYSCVDATTHVYFLYERLAAWSVAEGNPDLMAEKKRDELREFIQTQLFSEASGFFHDLPLVSSPAPRRFIEGLFPLVFGVATSAQAVSLVEDNLLNPRRFFTPHPIPSVAADDPAFELRMWRGPVWNSMTLLAAMGALRYGFAAAAAKLTAAALDHIEAQYEKTGSIWEFYHPFGGNQLDLARKPWTKFNTPSREYLGHCPVFALARLYSQATKKSL